MKLFFGMDSQTDMKVEMIVQTTVETFYNPLNTRSTIMHGDDKHTDFYRTIARIFLPLVSAASAMVIKILWFQD